MTDRLKGRIAVITGAANGIGEGCAARFRQEGAMVIGLDREEGEGIVCADLLDPASVAETFADIGREHGRIDILVNAAAIAVFRWIE